MTIFASAVIGPDGLPYDQIRLTGVSATGYHGVLAHERVQGQEFRADVVLHLDTRPAAVGDDLDATVSYAEIAQDVHDVLAGSPADLVETVAERIAATVLTRPQVAAVDVRVHKPAAPIAVPFDDVEVAIRRDRAKVPVVQPLAAEPTAAADAGGAPWQEPEPAPVALADVAPVAPPDVAPVAPPLEQVEATAPFEPVLAAIPAPPAEPAPAAVDPLDVDPIDPVEVVLAIGANLGDAQGTLRQAVADLDRLPGIQVTEVSPLARTSPVGGPEDQPDYLNAVLVARTTLSPRGLLRAAQAVESAHGRVREERWGPRTLDIDIVRYGSLVARGDDLEVPHPRANERAFVLVPWAEVQPDAVLPGLGGGPVARLAETAPDRAGIRWMALDWLTEPAARSGALPAAEAASAPVPSVGEPSDVSAPTPGVEAAPASGAAAEPPPMPEPTPWGPPPSTPGQGSVHAPVPPAPDDVPAAPAAIPPAPAPSEPEPPSDMWRPTPPIDDEWAPAPTSGEQWAPTNGQQWAPTPPSGEQWASPEPPFRPGLVSDPFESGPAQPEPVEPRPFTPTAPLPQRPAEPGPLQPLPQRPAEPGPLQPLPQRAAEPGPLQPLPQRPAEPGLVGFPHPVDAGPRPLPQRRVDSGPVTVQPGSGAVVLPPHPLTSGAVALPPHPATPSAGLPTQGPATSGLAPRPAPGPEDGGEERWIPFDPSGSR